MSHRGVMTVKEYTVKVSENVTSWWMEGERHREDGPAVEYANGDKTWWIKGRLHRIYGPAIDLVSGHKAWFFNGERHCEDGPAVEYANSNYEWWLNDVQYTEEEFYDKMNPITEYTIKELQEILGHKIKIVE
jgi:hypothetical protein